MKEIPLEYHRAKDSLTVDPRRFGLACVAQFGVSRLRRTIAPSGEHFHRGMVEIGFCLRSPLALETRGAALPVMPGSFFANQPDVPHCLTSRPNGLYVYYFLVEKPSGGATLLSLPKAESAALWRRLRRLPRVFPSGERAAQARKLFTRLLRLFDGPATAWTRTRLRQTALSLIVLLLELAERPADGADVSARVARAAEAIREHPERRITVDGLAGETALSPTHLINKFRKATGFPPVRYQLECRVEKARRLLLETDMSVSEIALSLGFGSLQHFSDAFVRIAGLPPSRLRRGRAAR